MLLFIKDDLEHINCTKLFQNISCYCLSNTTIKFNCIIVISKHLMLLFISCRSVYRQSIFLISKHLMLLFILMVALFQKGLTGFQNISCYCLSDNTTLENRKAKISKHLMLLFICFKLFFTPLLNVISKHLMLLFIQKAVENNLEESYFKTSHVIVYQLSSFCYLTHIHFKTSHVIVYHSQLLPEFRLHHIQYNLY